MGFFATLNARIAEVVRRRGGTSTWTRVALRGDWLVAQAQDGTRFEAEWQRLARVVGLRRDLHAGDETTLLLAFDDGQLVEVPSSCEGWTELCRSIERLPGAQPFGRWHASLLDMPVGKGAEVWSASPKGG